MLNDWPKIKDGSTFMGRRITDMEKDDLLRVIYWCMKELEYKDNKMKEYRDKYMGEIFKR